MSFSIGLGRMVSVSLFLAPLHSALTVLDGREMTDMKFTLLVLHLLRISLSWENPVVLREV